VDPVSIFSNWWPWTSQLNEIQATLNKLVEQGEKEMSAISDLQAADAAIQSAVAAAVTLIQGFVSGTVNADDPQVEAVVSDLNAAASALSGASAPPATASAKKA
jgi:cell division GTPase FtsZ